MKLVRRNANLTSVFLTILMLSIIIPYQPVLAAMIATDATLDPTPARQARDDINRLLSREDVQNALMAQGIDPLEAKARIDSLSDDEVIWIADQIDKTPAGGGIIAPSAFIVPIIVISAIIVLIIAGVIYLATSD